MAEQSGQRRSAAIWARAEGDDAAQEVQAQVTRCEQYALEHGYEVVRWYTQIGTWEEARPKYSELRDDMRQSQIHAVLFASKSPTFAQDDAARITQEAKERRVDVLTLSS